MKTICITLGVAVLLISGWAAAAQRTLADHLDDVQHLQKMQDASCPPSSNPSGGQ